MGKAKNLKNRVNSYRQVNQLNPRIYKLVRTAKKLKYEILASELEALLVEAELIRVHQPPFNIALKDDKTYLYLVITKEKYPRVLTARKKEINKGLIKGKVLGPFPSSYKLKEVLKIVRPIFPWCNQAGNLKQDSTKNNEKACFYYHLDLCPGACLGLVDPKDYQENIDQLTSFLRGQKKEVVANLTNEMRKHSQEEQFEKAALARDKVQLIKTVTNPEYKLSPNLVLPQLKDDFYQDSLIHLKKILIDYTNFAKSSNLNRIEGYDVSNIQGTNATVAMVTFIKGQSEPSEYRLFNIKTLNTPNDYHMLKEAILRRRNNFKWGQPDLLVIDGGKGQLRAAMKAWDMSCPVISLAKKPDRVIIPLGDKPGKYKVLSLPPNHPALRLLQQIRDESHRFSKKQHTKMRLKKMLS